MIQFLNMDSIRASLQELRALTNDELETLLSFATSPDAPKNRQLAVEKLVSMLKTKGRTGLSNFVLALEKTTEGTGHSDIVKAIRGDPEFPDVSETMTFRF